MSPASGQAHLLQSHIDEAILWLEKALRANAGLPGPHAYLAAAYALKGESERAATELAEAQRLRGEDSWSNLARFRADTRYEAPSIRFLAEATIFDGLRKAGMPEERMPPARSAEEGSQPPLITAISPTPSTAVRNETDS